MGAVGRSGGAALAVAFACALAIGGTERPGAPRSLPRGQRRRGHERRPDPGIDALYGAGQRAHRRPRGHLPRERDNWPLCCPSRATLLTDQYAHNHGVLGNTPPFGGFDRLGASETLPAWLQRAGYYTAHIGKFLNGYENSAVGVPAGWSEWHGSERTYLFYGYELLEGGQRSPTAPPPRIRRPDRAGDVLDRHLY